MTRPPASPPPELHSIGSISPGHSPSSPACCAREPRWSSTATSSTVGSHTAPAFADWLKSSYLPSYPTPARHAYFGPEAAEAADFSAPSYDESEILVPLTCAQLAGYLLSQSNAAIAIESGRDGAEALRDQIINQTSAFFPDGQPTDVVFGVRVWTTVLRK